MTTTRTVSLDSIHPAEIYGPNNDILRAIEGSFAAKIIGRGEQLIIEGEEREVEAVAQLFTTLVRLVQAGNRISRDDVSLLVHLPAASGPSKFDHDVPVVISTKKNLVKPRTPGQYYYVRSMEENDIVFTIGPAGTGKTFLAVCLAMAALLDERVDRVIFTRPAIEAGESLGFLPGDLEEKVAPYLRPLYDALFDILPQERVNYYLTNKIIEIIPLAYMRGRTLNNAFIILDEAQNTTPLQMKMFLTRLGVNAKAIVTGDITQIDLADKKESGLITIQHILKDILRIKFIYLDKSDVVRHKLVRDIVQAYEKHEANLPA